MSSVHILLFLTYIYTILALCPPVSESEINSLSLFVCFSFRPNVEMSFKTVELSQGQWISGPEDWTPTTAPSGKIPANEDTRICSSGCRFDQSGTVGHVVISDAQDNDITVTWTDTLDQYFKYTVKAADPKKFHIENIELTSYKIKFNIMKLNDTNSGD